MSWTVTPIKSGIRFYQYQQTTPASVWTIYHAMGVEPMVDINANDDHGVLQKAFPLSVVQLDENNTEITWSSPRTGFVNFAADRTA
jgi:hypothetical protein